MASKAPIPLILCGKNPNVGNMVIQLLKPEYEVIKFIASVSLFTTDAIPLLQQNKAVAIIAGGGYGDAAVNEMRSAIPEGTKKVPWFRPDRSKSTPATGTSVGQEEYARVATERVKVRMGEVLGSGKEGEKEEYSY